MTQTKQDPFFDEMDIYIKQLDERMPAHLQAMLDAGASITYTDDNGRYVRQMPNGEIIVLQEESN